MNVYVKRIKDLSIKTNLNPFIIIFLKKSKIYGKEIYISLYNCIHFSVATCYLPPNLTILMNFKCNIGEKSDKYIFYREEP